MRLGQQQADVEAISTGSLSLDLALGIGGLPKGRIIEIMVQSLRENNFGTPEVTKRVREEFVLLLMQNMQWIQFMQKN